MTTQILLHSPGMKKFREYVWIYKEMFYSDFVCSQLNQEELHISQLLLCKWIDLPLLASLYKSKLDKNI